MKRLALIFALLLCTLPLSGCAILFEEPSALILPPASDQEEYVERTLISSFLNDGAHLQVPEDMEDPQRSSTLISMVTSRTKSLRSVQQQRP